MCTMIKKMIVFFLLVLMVGFSLVFADGPHILKDLKKPDMLRVDKDELYVIQGTTILVYSLKDFSLIRKFGKAGSGRGELDPIRKVFFFKNHFISVVLRSILCYNLT